MARRRGWIRRRRARQEQQWGAILTGVGLGAGLMYMLDPDSGRRRRRLVVDKTVSLTQQSGAATGRAARDLRNRAQGVAAAARRPFQHEDVDDQTLAERVRAKMGRVVSHPHAIEVVALRGRITVSGPILADEADALLKKVRSIPGVAGVEDRLDRHEGDDHLPSLQGGAPRSELAELAAQNWAPGLRCVAATAGSGLLAWGIRRGDGLGLALGSAGAALLARAGTNQPLTRVVGLPGEPRLVEVHKTIEIQAPVDVVYGLWTRYENFPRFMSTLKEVRDDGQGRSHWSVSGPGGIPVSWNAEITRLVPDQELSWRSLPGSIVPNAGTIHFTSTDNGGTRVDVQLSYTPPGGALGLVAAKLFGADAKSQMDEDLLRMKTFLETGQTPRDAAAPPEMVPVS
jgi:uncharacterized membrane protein